MGIRKKGGQDGLIRKEGAREIKNRGPTSPRIITEVTLKAGESYNTWIRNQVRLKAQL